MKNYITPNIELTTVCVTDVITASRIEVSSNTPTVLDIEDGRDFN